MSRHTTIDLTQDDDDEIQTISPVAWAASQRTQVSSFNSPSSFNINLEEKRRLPNMKYGPPRGQKRKTESPVDPPRGKRQMLDAPASTSNKDQVEIISHTTAHNKPLPPSTSKLRGCSTASSRAHSAASHTHVASGSSTQRPTPTFHEVIELSDEEPPQRSKWPQYPAQSFSRQDPIRATVPRRPVIFHRLQTPHLFDKDILQAVASEEDYCNIHAGFDLDDPGVWLPPQSNSSKVAVRVDSALDDDSDSESGSGSEMTQGVVKLRLSRKRQWRLPEISIPGTRPRGSSPHLSDKAPEYRCWHIAPMARNLKRLQRFFLPGEGIPRMRNSLSEALDLADLKPTASFKSCHGSIIRVEQRDGWVAIAGAAIGGTPDSTSPDGTPPTVDPYNREGSLCTYFHQRDNQVRILLGHQINRGSQVNHYGVNDVKFCPEEETRFVSSGNDHTVQVWQKSPQGKFHESFRLSDKLEGVPHALAFKPGTSILAVAAGTVYIFPALRLRCVPTKLGNVQENQVVGNMCWGTNYTKDFLFASSEPTDPQLFTGWNKAFHVETSVSAYKFESSGAGDAMSLEPSGASLAIATRTSHRNGILRLYDVQRKNGKPYAKINLAPFEMGIEGEIHDASFSPDGVYLALGRHDNRTDVYDSRYLGKGVLYNFSHDNAASQVSPGYEPCGVMKLQWVQKGDRLGLVTSGGDGCVRLWDPLRAAQRNKYGVVLAKVNSDIATFSLGDRFKGEHQLVVGDCTGEVSIFDRLFETNFQN